MIDERNGRELKQFQVKLFGEHYSVYVIPRIYSNNSLCLEVVCDDGPFGVLTANLNGALQDEECAYVKTYGENETWAESLANQLGEATGVAQTSGFVTMPLYRLDTEKCYTK